MRNRGIVVAIVFAVLVVVVFLRLGAGEPPPPPSNAPSTGQAPAVNGVDIYIAAQAIPVGTTITKDMVAIQKWPEHLMLDGFIRADGPGGVDGAVAKVAGAAPTPQGGDVAGVVGAVARSAFQPQEPILRTKLANPNDPSFLAGSLPAGMRVVTIQVNEVEGLAGFVAPGDHVDVLLTHEVNRPMVTRTATKKKTDKGTEDEVTLSEAMEKEKITETVLNNVTVAAVDQRASGGGGLDKEGKMVIPRTVSLMVSPVDAQRIRLAQGVGTITLSLRSLADRDVADPALITEKSTISQFRGVNPELGDVGSGGVRVYRGVDSGQ